MTLIAVSIAVRDPEAVEPALRRAAGAVGAGARLVEWRVDELAAADGGLGAACALVERSPAPSIVTCRGRAEGGSFGGDERCRAELYEAVLLADTPPRYVDIEHAAWRGSPVLRQSVGAALERTRPRDVAGALILSVHDFEQRPPDLLQHVEQMTEDPACAVVKVAWHARSLRDNLEALDLLAERRKPTIALCMGRFGLLSRVLAPKFGGLLVYASDGRGGATAPGQPTVPELVGRYRFEDVGPRTAVYGVIGWPAEHSLGPDVHNGGFAAVRHDGVYVPLPVPPEWEHFKATVGALVDHPRLDFRGASVTLPHKVHLVRFVEERGGRIDEEAVRLRSANTLFADETVGCTSTDAPALVASLCGGMGIEPRALAERRIAVLGAGGFARAVVGILADARARVIVFNRTPERARVLAKEFGAAVGDNDKIGCGCFDVFINCTPVGMAGGPAPDASPLPADVPLDKSVTVLDTVYTPRRTPLVRQAEAAGARVIGGLDMFLRQAAIQFVSWTGREAPIEVFRERSAEDPGRP